ncbi:MAG TPA: hypothetical protein VHM26_05655, partial [Chitinophagaceae bacterium]|nr:hypothetical protein [Chitinophagaceae bacterium]
HERVYKHGSNKKKRADAGREIEHVKYVIKHLFRKYPEAYVMASGGETSTDYGRAIVMDEFFQNHYIVGDVGTLLNSIREKIKSFEIGTDNQSENPVV